MRKFAFIGYIVLGLCLQNIVRGQGGGYTLPQITPKSPNVAGFEKYGDVPVSLGKGIADISIPLMSITVDGLTVPITFSYHNNGFKVDEIPSWAGLGWDLQAGGMISRRQKGLDDFGQYGLITNSGAFQDLSKFLQGTLTSDQSFSYLERILNDQEDSQFDLFYFNFPGYSGTFYFDNNQQAHIVPQSNLKVVKTTNGLKVTDNSGNQFFFETAENALMYPLSDVEIRPSFGGVSAYYISKIITKNGRTIAFKYKSYNLQYNRSNRYLVFHPYVTSNCPGNSVGYSDTYISNDVLLPDSIVFDEGYVHFMTGSSPRQDLLALNNSANIPGLSGVELVDNKGAVIRQFTINEGYFGGTPRLKLSSIQERNGSTLGRNWQFSYYGEQNSLPPFFSNSKDHWGYNNNKTNTTLIPVADYGNFLLNWADYLNGGYADRTSDFNAAQVSLLRAIKYPTGGTTTLEYEPNQLRVQRYTDVTSLSPFLQLPTGALIKQQIAGDWTNVQHVSGYETRTVTGSFTITERNIYNVRIYQDLDPSHFFDPIINFTGPKGSVDTIMFLLSQHTTPNSLQGQKDISLAAGTYTYSLTSGVSCNDNTGTCIPLQANFDISKWVLPAGSGVGPYIIGGCRIAKITSNDGAGVRPMSTRKFIYDDSLNHVVFRNIPSYYNQSTVGYMLTGTTCSICGPEYIVHDENVRPNVGNDIEYVNVTELDDADGYNGKTDNVFMTSSDEGGSIYGEPFVEPFNTNWRSGNLLSKKKYKYENASYSLVESTNNNYFTSGKQNIQNGIKVDTRVICPAVSSLWTQHGTSLATWFSETFYQNQTIANVYSNNVLENRRNSTAQSSYHVLPTLVEKYDSKNESVREKIVYSFDYSNNSTATSSDALGIKQIVSLNILVPIEKIEIKTINGTDYVTSATLNTYKTDKPEVYKTYSLNITAPLPYGSFTQSYIDASGNLVKDSHYEERIVFDKYDARNNLVEVFKTNNEHAAYIYDYKSIYPIAEVKNAGVASIAYSSFEADGMGNWNIIGTARNTSNAMTGIQSYDLSNGNISSGTLDPGTTYIVSFWSQPDANVAVSGTQNTQRGGPHKNWYYWEKTVTGVSTITVSGTGLIDELRLYPVGAQMTTYAYRPLVGMITSCDVNNRITSYEYDDLQRLLRIRDIDNNILKQFEYQYQVLPAPVYNDIQIKTFTRNNCLAGGVPSSVTATIPAGTYMSLTSKDDANQQAIAALEVKGRNDANTNGTCTYYNTQQIQTYNRSNCTCLYTGSAVADTAAAGAFSSLISPDDANQKAINYLTATGPDNANAKGTCTTSCTGASKKIINCACVTGTSQIISQYETGSGSSLRCVTTFGYVFPDGSYVVTNQSTTGGHCP